MEVNQLQDLFHKITLDQTAAAKKIFEDKLVELSAADESGDTALHVAAAKGRREIVTFLVERGVSPNVPNKAGSTPLHKAALSNQLWIVQYLLKHGGSATIKNNAGMLPEHLSNQERVRKVLEGDEVKIAKVQIPREAHRKVIGAKGAKIAEIRALSGCQITVPKPEDTETAITLRGRPDGIAKAKELILKVGSEGLRIVPEGAISGDTCNPDHRRLAAVGEDSVTVAVPIPKDRHSILMRRFAKQQLERLIEATGVSIAIPAESSADASIVCRGSQEAVDAAVSKLFELTRLARPTRR